MDRLANARLVTTSFADETRRDIMVEIIHDSLIREWKLLQEWIKDNRFFMAWQGKIHQEALDWKAPQMREKERLLAGTKLNEAEKWLHERGDDLDPDDRDYINESINHRERDKAEQERVRYENDHRRRQNMYMLTALLAIAVIFATFGWFQWDHAEKNRQEAMVLYLAGKSQLLQSGQADSFFQGILLAIESLKRQPNQAGDTALRRGLSLLPRKISCLPHNGNVVAVAFSPNGSMLATASGDKTARLFNTLDGNELARMNHADLVWAVAFSPDGTKIVTASSDKTAKIWDAATKKELARLAHDDWVIAVAFNPDSTRIATASLDGTGRIWDVVTGRELFRLIHDDEVRVIAFSPDGKKIATGSKDKTARIWDATTGKELAKLSHSDSVNAVTFSPDGAHIATGSSDGTTRIWNVATGVQLVRVNHSDLVWAVAFLSLIHISEPTRPY